MKNLQKRPTIRDDHRRRRGRRQLSKAVTLFVGSMLALLAGGLGLAQQGPQLTPNYRDADIRVVADQVQQVIGDRKSTRLNSSH